MSSGPAATDVFARIACGVDGSEASLESVRQVARLAPEGAEVALFGVVNESATVSIGWPAFPISRAAKVTRAAIDAGIEAAQAELPAHVTVQSGVVTGPPGPLSVVEAKVRNATVVAVGSHGHRRMSGIVIGSVATLLLHSAPCSVLLTRPAQGGFPRSIVVGLDGSDESRLAARHAVAIAARTGADLSGLVAMGRTTAVDHAAVRSIVTDNGGFPLTDDERDPVDAFSGVQADLLVLGSRGLRGVHALGSVSERAAHRAGCSVLVIRPTAA
ncbi:MAG TPA: universal stress protein [Gaiellales bacterium]|nr:universal stress protein [Gaiellales bacterium]